MSEIKVKISTLPSSNTCNAVSDIIPINVSGTTSQITPKNLILASANSVANAVSLVPRVFGTFAYNINNINNVTQNNYILLSSDDGKLVAVNNVNTNIVIVPTGLSNTFSCSILRIGSGAVQLGNANNVFLYNSSNSYSLSGQFAMASIFSYGVANTFVLTGDVI